jgi:hypothetical protein
MADGLMNLFTDAALVGRSQTIIDDATIVFARLIYLDDFVGILITPTRDVRRATAIQRDGFTDRLALGSV